MMVGPPRKTWLPRQIRMKSASVKIWHLSILCKYLYQCICLFVSLSVATNISCLKSERQETQHVGNWNSPSKWILNHCFFSSKIYERGQEGMEGEQKRRRRQLRGGGGRGGEGYGKKEGRWRRRGDDDSGGVGVDERKKGEKGEEEKDERGAGKAEGKEADDKIA